MPSVLPSHSDSHYTRIGNYSLMKRSVAQQLRGLPVTKIVFPFKLIVVTSLQNDNLLEGCQAMPGAELDKAVHDDFI